MLTMTKFANTLLSSLVFGRSFTVLRSVLLAALFLTSVCRGEHLPLSVRSPDGHNSIDLEMVGGDQLAFSIHRAGHLLIGRSPLGPELGDGKPLASSVQIVNVQSGRIDERFEIPWGKTERVINQCSFAKVRCKSSDIDWEIELRAYDDGVAFQYRLLPNAKPQEISIRNEATKFNAVGAPKILFNQLTGFVSSHESLYEHRALAAVPAGKLLDMPLLLEWPNGPAAAICEARIRHFAGMYLERPAQEESTLRCRLSPQLGNSNVCVKSTLPLESPWRVVLLADHAGKLQESNLLVCLNDPPHGDFSWAHPGKTSFHWWNGEYEDDYKLPAGSSVFLDRHRKYIDFCAKHKIAYHAVSGDGRSWYKQSSTDYGMPSEDADVRVPRPEIHLPEILAYARERGVDIRLWVHWKPLSAHLEEAFSLYESWGVKGLMVDFLDRDDQEMIEFSERMLECAARHKLHIQIHGSSKNSGEQRTFVNLFNREGVLNLEYLKWSALCTPQHNVDVAFTRALAGPVDYHLGGFRSVSRSEFRPQDRNPVVMGTRCHNLALYVVYENPMPMVADSPNAYDEQAGFEFLEDVPTTWDETRYVAGEPGEYIVLARRKGATWYVAGITNWTPRELKLSPDFLGGKVFDAQLYVDGSMDESRPNEIAKKRQRVGMKDPLQVSLAAGGGFIAVLNPSR